MVVCRISYHDLVVSSFDRNDSCRPGRCIRIFLDTIIVAFGRAQIALETGIIGPIGYYRFAERCQGHVYSRIIQNVEIRFTANTVIAIVQVIDQRERNRITRIGDIAFDDRRRTQFDQRVHFEFWLRSGRFYEIQIVEGKVNFF